VTEQSSFLRAWHNDSGFIPSCRRRDLCLRLFIGDGISNWNSGRRIIAVKGLSEREVAASVAVWTIGYNATGDDLDASNWKLSDSTKAVIASLKTPGFDDKDERKSVRLGRRC
jgi:hypothetical protein